MRNINDKIMELFEDPKNKRGSILGYGTSYKIQLI